MDDLQNISTEERPFSAILDTIWKTPIAICEQAQFFNPDYVSQFLVRHMWNEMTDKDSFVMLISFIVYETRRMNIEQYFDDSERVNVTIKNMRHYFGNGENMNVTI